MNLLLRLIKFSVPFINFFFFKFLFKIFCRLDSRPSLFCYKLQKYDNLNYSTCTHKNLWGLRPPIKYTKWNKPNQCKQIRARDRKQKKNHLFIEFFFIYSL